MASNINPQNIDGAYPVAGQDNDSQGFRDNFTNTRTNFQFARDEITDLQNNVVLKAALTGTTLNNNMNGSILSNAQLQNMSQTAVSLGALSGVLILNYATGSYFTASTTGSVTVGFENLPAAGRLAEWTLAITISNVAHTLTLPSAVGAGVSSTSTEYIIGWVSNTITFQAPGTYVFQFRTNNGGSAIFIEDLVRTTFFASGNLVANNASITNSLVAEIISGNVIIANGSIVTNLAASGNVVANLVAADSAVITDLGADTANVVNVAVSGAIIANIGQMADVTVINAADNDILVYNDTNGQWENTPFNDFVPVETYVVTIADNGSGVQDVFFFDGVALQTSTGVQLPFTFKQDTRYRFDLSAVINADAPLRFSTTPDSIVTVGNVPPSTITDYTTDVTISGVAGTAGSYVEILITDSTPETLYFWGIEQDPGLDTSLIGAARPISVEKIQYYAGADLYSANGNVRLDTSTTVITSSSDLVGNLNAGSPGQIKILAYGNTATGNTLITVGNAAWGGSGLANLSVRGSAATLQYVGNLWFCVGNNGVTFT